MRTAEPVRSRLVSAIIIGITAMNIGFFVRDPTLHANSPADRLIVLALILIAIAALTIIPSWRTLMANLAGRQYLRFIAVLLGSILINRVCGFVLDEPSLSIMTRDLLVVAVTLVVVRLPIPGMWTLGLGTTAATLLMVALPDYARLIFLIVTSAIPLVLLGLDHRQRRVEQR